jgi:branched-chain amino acid transport system permease protein
MREPSQTVGTEARWSPLRQRVTLHAPAAAAVAFLLIAPEILRPDLVSLFNRILIMGLLAMSLDLVMGYAGLWSFGHAALFGAAAYLVAILVTKLGVTSFWLAAPAGIGAAVVAAVIFALLGLRTRKIYFMLITLAFGGVVYTWTMMSPYELAGGSNGIWNVPRPDFGFGGQLGATGYYYFTFVVVAVCATVLYLITLSPFGNSLIGTQDNEVRAKTLGYNTWLRKFVAFVLSGFFAGLAGVLFVYFNGGISPEQIGIGGSGLVVVMVMIGGQGTLWGALVGSAVVLGLNYFVSLYASARWPLFLGLIFIAAVFFAKGGVAPRFMSWWKKVARGRRRSSVSR